MAVSGISSERVWKSYAARHVTLPISGLIQSAELNPTISQLGIFGTPIFAMHCTACAAFFCLILCRTWKCQKLLLSPAGIMEAICRICFTRRCHKKPTRLPSGEYREKERKKYTGQKKSNQKHDAIL